MTILGYVFLALAVIVTLIHETEQTEGENSTRDQEFFDAKFVVTGGPDSVVMTTTGSVNDDTIGIITKTSCAASDDKVSIIIYLHFQR